MVTLLATIVNRLDMVVARMDAIAATVLPDDADAGCQHPEGQRIDLSSMGDQNHWVCRVCRYDNKA